MNPDDNDQGHLMPQAEWDKIDHAAAQAAQPDPAAVARAHALIRGLDDSH